MNNPSKDDQNLLISISTIKNKFHDATCVLVVGDHPFVIRDSYVVYKDPQLRNVDGIARCVASNSFIPQTDMDSAVVQRIIDGIRQSEFTPPWVEVYCDENGIV